MRQYGLEFTAAFSRDAIHRLNMNFLIAKTKLNQVRVLLSVSMRIPLEGGDSHTPVESHNGNRRDLPRLAPKFICAIFQLRASEDIERIVDHPLAGISECAVIKGLERLQTPWK